MGLSTGRSRAWPVVAAGMAWGVAGLMTPAWATNGFNLYAFGAESSALGGADVALIRDTASLVTNPAGLVHIAGRRLETTVDPYYFVDVRHQDSLGNDEQNRPRVGGFTSGAYAQRLSETVVAGIGAYVAGGLGFEYRDLDSGFGTRGDILTRFSVIRVAPGLGWEVNPRLSVGASLSLNYAVLRQKYFPDSSVLNPLSVEDSLFGYRLDDLTAIRPGINLGAKFAVNEAWVLGLAYRSRAKLDFDGGVLRVNYEALSAGRIDYRDAELRGISIPQDLQAGFSVRLHPAVTVAAELNWIDWSRAVRALRVEASDPQRNPLPLLIPDQVVQEQALGWRDQVVVGLGVMVALDADTRLRLGYNHGRRPVPRDLLTPLVAAIPETHYALGFGRDFGTQWELNVGMTYLPRLSVRYQNPQAPITRDARETHETLAFQITVARRW